MLFECGVVFVVFRQYVVRPSQANEDDGGGGQGLVVGRSFDLKLGIKPPTIRSNLHPASCFLLKDEAYRHSLH